MRNPFYRLQSIAARSLGVFGDSKPLNSLFPVSSFVDESCFITKAGSFGLALRIEGRGTDGMTPDQMETASASIRKALQGLSDQFRLYQYTWKHSGEAIPADIDEGNVASETLRQRRQFLEKKSQDAQLFSVDQYWILLYEPSLSGAKENKIERAKKALTRRNTVVVGEGKLRRNTNTLKTKAAALITDLRSVLSATVLGKEECFFLLRVLGNLDAARADYLRLPADESYIDHLLCDLPLSAGREGLGLWDKPVEVMSLWKAPAHHRPNFYREIQKIKADYLLATEWRGLDKLDADKLVSDAQTHFATSANLKGLLATVFSSLFQVLFGKQTEERGEEQKDEAKIDNVEELGKLARAINQGDGLGEYSATLILYGQTREQLRESMNEASARLREFNALFAPETYNALNALLSIHPGNTHFNFRRQYIQRSMAADMALAYQEYQGEIRNTHLNKEYLIACTTQDDTPHFLNLYHEGVFGVLITGKTGSGKSVSSNAFLDHMQKYEPETLVLDVGGSYRTLCRKYDGAYMSLADLNFKCNPFGMENSPRTRRSLSAFVKILLENEGYKPNYKDTRIIFDAVGEIMERPADQRRLSNLNLGDALMEPLYRWIGGGEFGSIFDNIEDEITFSKFKVFDFQGIEDVPEIAEPLFFYLFMRHERIVQDPARTETIKILWADEAWRFIENQTCRKQFIKAGKTYRKHNGAIALATQSAFDYKNAGLFEIISEVCPTKILLANPSADMKAYAELFHLNPAEVEMFRTLIGKRQFMVKKEEQPAQVLNMILSPYELVQYQNSPFENARRERAIKQYGWEAGLKKLAEEIAEEQAVNA